MTFKPNLIVIFEIILKIHLVLPNRIRITIKDIVFHHPLTPKLHIKNYQLNYLVSSFLYLFLLMF